MQLAAQSADVACLSGHRRTDDAAGVPTALTLRRSLPEEPLPRVGGVIGFFPGSNVACAIVGSKLDTSVARIAKGFDQDFSFTNGYRAVFRTMKSPDRNGYRFL